MTARKHKDGSLSVLPAAANTTALPDLPADFQIIMDAFAGLPGVSCGAGWAKGNTVLKVHGTIFAMLAHGHLVVKLSETRVDSLVQDKVGSRFDPRRTGKGMREWCEVPLGLGNWLGLAKEAFDFAATHLR